MSSIGSLKDLGGCALVMAMLQSTSMGRISLFGWAFSILKPLSLPSTRITIRNAHIIDLFITFVADFLSY